MLLEQHMCFGCFFSMSDIYEMKRECKIILVLFKVSFEYDSYQDGLIKLSENEVQMYYELMVGLGAYYSKIIKYMIESQTYTLVENMYNEWAECAYSYRICSFWTILLLQWKKQCGRSIYHYNILIYTYIYIPSVDIICGWCLFVNCKFFCFQFQLFKIRKLKSKSVHRHNNLHAIRN